MLEKPNTNEQQWEETKQTLKNEPMKCSPEALAYMHELLVWQETQRQKNLHQLLEKFDDDNIDPFDEGLIFTIEEWNFVRQQLARDLRESEQIVWEIEAYRKAVQQ